MTKEYQDNWYREHPGKRQEYDKKAAKKNPSTERSKRWRMNNPERHREIREAYYKVVKEKRISQKKIIMMHYGGLRCVCCGEQHIEFLSLDHIKGGGNRHRREIGAGKLYRWIIKNDYPDDFQVLCMNCNWAKGKFGECPHKKEKTGLDFRAV